MIFRAKPLQRRKCNSLTALDCKTDFWTVAREIPQSVWRLAAARRRCHLVRNGWTVGRTGELILLPALHSYELRHTALLLLL